MTTSNLAIRSTHALSGVQPISLLRENPSLGPKHVPIAGTVRPGTYRITLAARQVPQLLAAFKEAIAAGKTFQEARLELAPIAEKLKFKEGIIAPQNIPFFMVKERDFVDATAAQTILDRYGEDYPVGNETRRRLTKLPIVFPSDDESIIVPHNLTMYAQSGRKYWSDYRLRDGAAARVCMTHDQIDPKQRVFGGRPIVERADRQRCDPNRCAEYQTAACKLTGELRFYVPGVPGLGLIRLPTNSYYSIEGILNKLALIRAQRGRVDGMIAGKPFLYLTKRLCWITRLVKGHPKREQQLLVVLETDESMVEVAAQLARITDAVPTVTVASNASSAAAAPTGSDDRSISASSERVTAAAAAATSPPGAALPVPQPTSSASLMMHALGMTHGIPWNDLYAFFAMVTSSKLWPMSDQESGDALTHLQEAISMDVDGFKERLAITLSAEES